MIDPFKGSGTLPYMLASDEVRVVRWDPKRNCVDPSSEYLRLEAEGSRHMPTHAIVVTDDEARQIARYIREMLGEEEE